MCSSYHIHCTAGIYFLAVFFCCPDICLFIVQHWPMHTLYKGFIRKKKDFITQTSHPKNIYNHNNIAVMQLLTFRTDRQN